MVMKLPRSANIRVLASGCDPCAHVYSILGNIRLKVFCKRYDLAWWLTVGSFQLY